MKFRLQKYSHEQNEFMRECVNDFENYGRAYPNQTSKLAFIPLLVRKPRASYTLTVDLHSVNLFTSRHHFAMANLEHELAGQMDIVFFASFKVPPGYCKLLLALLSQNCQSFITADAILKATQVLHGTTNAAINLRSFLTGIIPIDLMVNILIWA